MQRLNQHWMCLYLLMKTPKRKNGTDAEVYAKKLISNIEKNPWDIDSRLKLFKIQSGGTRNYRKNTMYLSLEN